MRDGLSDLRITRGPGRELENAGSRDDARRLSRLRGHLLLVSGSVLMGMAAALFDQLTVTISPEYFLEGKGLAASGGSLRVHVAWLGFRAGLPLGASIAGVGWLCAERDASFSWRAWLETIAKATAMALPLCALLMAWLDPFAIHAASAGAWSDAEATRYLVCWGLHIGAYAGIVGGVGRAAWRRRG